MAKLAPNPRPEYHISEPYHTLVFDPIDDDDAGPFDVYVWIPNPRAQGWMGPPMAIWRFLSVPTDQPLTIRLDLKNLGSTSCKLLVAGELWSSVEGSVRSDYRIWPRQSMGVSLVGSQGQAFGIHRFDLVIAHPDILSKHYSRLHHATSYTPEPDHFSEAFHQARLRQARRVVGPLLGHSTRVLEAGSGFSLLRMAFDSVGGFPGRLFACDWDLDAITRVAKEYPTIEWFVSGVEHLPFKNDSFDVVHVGEVIEHVIDVQAALREWRRVVKPGGHLIVTTPNRKHRMARLTGIETPENLEHLREYTVDELTEELRSAGFSVVKVEGLYLALCAVRLPGQRWIDLLRVRPTFRGKRILLKLAMEAGRLVPSWAYNICAVARKDGASTSTWS